MEGVILCGGAHIQGAYLDALEEQELFQQNPFYRFATRHPDTIFYDKNVDQILPAAHLNGKRYYALAKCVAEDISVLMEHYDLTGFQIVVDPRISLSFGATFEDRMYTVRDALDYKLLASASPLRPFF